MKKIFLLLAVMATFAIADNFQIGKECPADFAGIKQIIPQNPNWHMLSF